MVLIYKVLFPSISTFETPPAVFPRIGRAPVTLAVLRLPHALLWGATPPPPYGGPIQLDLPAEAAAEPTPVPAPVAAP